MLKVIITGGAGFIGSNLIGELLKAGNQITCIDNFDPFYPEPIKRLNIEEYLNNSSFRLIECDIRNYDELKSKLNGEYDAIIHLAAKAGVRPSILNPKEYQEVNVIGTQNLLEIAKELHIKQFVFASSSSVYGVNANFPWQEEDKVLEPISPYAASKVSGELIGHVYTKLYDIRFIALRFFTVFGPRQRPDLAIHKFFKAIYNDKPIDIYGDGSTKRDYTFVQDIVEAIGAALLYDKSDYEIVNIGNNNPIKLLELINLIEKVIGKKAKFNYLPEQPGDVPITFADVRKATKLLAYQPKVSMEQGLVEFNNWFKEGK